jgi:hypothetical protein
MNTFINIDWCHEIYLDICCSIESLHEKLGESQVSYTILGCSIIPVVRASILFLLHTYYAYCCWLLCIGFYSIVHTTVMFVSKMILNCDRTVYKYAYKRDPLCIQLWYTMYTHRINLSKAHRGLFFPLLSIYLQLFYLDWLHHHEGPMNRLTIPHISAFTNEMITKLIAADVVRDLHAIVGYGALDVHSQSPYAHTFSISLAFIYWLQTFYPL